ncbi:hypothetical protein [Hymenobacter edaphi]|uniref:Uncharacterized protein n=1 Tax=Hymenobacter edaphi TaxID=2211146 RepID=A0A328B3R2_9BACT|nr:hypothetical protein [Hymenobacter edaphi]RAK62082.1 hypothetical protein DLM85_24405 [Hymenobacter edaphi]
MNAPKLRVEGQLITFRLLSDEKTWKSSMQLAGRSVDLELELDVAQIDKANWPKLETTLELLIARYGYFIAKAESSLRYLARESGLFDEISILAIKPVLNCITLDFPFSAMLSFQLNFCLDAAQRLDESGDWKVSFLKEHLVGLERVQG